MFKKGDKVVYISATTYRYKKNTIYNIEEVYIESNYKDSKDELIISYKIDNLHTYINNFISLKEYRKQKLKQLCLSQETK